MQGPTYIIEQLRSDYQRRLLHQIWGYRRPSPGSPAGTQGLPSNADTSSTTSTSIAAAILTLPQIQLLTPPTNAPKVGQAAGRIFAQETREFLESTFSQLAHVRPGLWTFQIGTGRVGIGAYDQYQHLTALRTFLRTNPAGAAIRSSFALDYLVDPDIVVIRHPIPDSMINSPSQPPIINPTGNFARHTPLRAANPGNAPVLHASVSCKWTLRSDRVQNTRTEALNLFRNRKGSAPRIVAVTAEPLPSRLESIALGTGDLDCVYHFALPELQQALATLAATSPTCASQQTLLTDLVNGRRLRDISDLPFDLAI